MNRLRNIHLFRMYEYIRPFINYSIPDEECLYGNKVLVIAPHQNDEAVGCAGTVIKHVKAGGHVEIAFCTHDSSERMKEVSRAVSIMGSQKNHYMQFPMQTLSGNKNFEDNLAMIINKVDPDTVFLPFWFDKHSDHIAVSKAIINIKQKIDLNFMVYSYAVLSPLNPNCLFDISDVWELKKKMIECYKTQTVLRDYVKIAQWLNQYWAEIKRPGMLYAETFFKATVQEYISLGKRIFK